MLLTILIIIAAAVLLLIIFIFTASHSTGVVPMPSFPSERSLVSKILEHYPYDGITDLGSGWGGMARTLSRRLPGRTVTAVEKSIVPHSISMLRSVIMRYRSVSCIRADILKMKLHDNEAYITYLSAPVMKKLRASFEREQPSGGVLISIAFAMPGWTPTRIEYADGLLRTSVYIYEM